jgi:hypothetical protein
MNFADALYYLAPIIGIGTIAIGISAVLRPEAMSKKFGIPVTGSALPYVISTGARDIFIGLTILILYYFKLWQALGYINLFTGIVAISDFLVVRKYGHKKTSLTHLFGAVLVVSYGSWLISY